jgi:hypothetical protein
MSSISQFEKFFICDNIKIMETLSKNKSAQDVQNKIFRKMSADKSFKMANNLSMFLLNLNKQSNKKNGIPKSHAKNRKNS